MICTYYNLSDPTLTSHKTRVVNVIAKFMSETLSVYFPDYITHHGPFDLGNMYCVCMHFNACMCTCIQLY